MSKYSELADRLDLIAEAFSDVAPSAMSDCAKAAAALRELEAQCDRVGSMNVDLYAELEKASAERDRLRGLIDEHNSDCVSRCGEGEQEGVRCGYRPWFPRRCPECPRYDMIEVAALERE
jgi:hypothetical protein